MTDDGAPSKKVWCFACSSTDGSSGTDNAGVYTGRTRVLRCLQGPHIVIVIITVFVPNFGGEGVSPDPRWMLRPRS